MKIRIKGARYFPWAAVRNAISIVETAAKQADQEISSRISEDFLSASEALSKDYSVSRSQYKGSHLLLKSVAPGSIVFGGTVVGVAVALVGKTLSKSIDKSWIKSKSHKKLLRYLSSTRRERAQSLAQHINRQAEADPNVGSNSEIIAMFAQSKGKGKGRVAVTVVVTPKDSLQPT